MAEVFGFLFLVTFVIAAMWLTVRWTRDFADLLWMLTIRPFPVAIASLVALGLVMLLAGFLFGFSALSPTSFLIGLLISPLLAVRGANGIARRMVVLPKGDELRKIPAFIFALRRQEQRDAYEAPPISR